MKLALGTVQFGLPYGIANSAGRVPFHEAKSILELAKNLGVDTLDTAADYGESESVLGELGVDRFRVITKLPTKLCGEKGTADKIVQYVKEALERLQVDSVHGLLLHRSEQLNNTSYLHVLKAIDELKSAGLVKKFGVSIYEPSELDSIIEFAMPDIVQAPLNLLDRRLISSGWLQKLFDSGVEVHARSAFLQGLLLMPRNEVPENFAPWAVLFDRWHSWLATNSIDPLVACLAAVSDARIERVVVGVDNAMQLQRIVVAAKDAIAQSYPRNFNCEDRDLIMPSNWKSL